MTGIHRCANSARSATWSKVAKKRAPGHWGFDMGSSGTGRKGAGGTEDVNKDVMYRILSASVVRGGSTRVSKCGGQGVGESRSTLTEI